MASRANASSGLKLNVGCGTTPTPGFVNLDNSLSARLAQHPFLATLMTAGPLALLGSQRAAFVAQARAAGILWGTAQHLPVEDGVAALVYSSHMLEHLTRDEAARFFQEANRVLAPGGWLRIAVPDLHRLARGYVEGAIDADQFVASTLMATDRPRGLAQRLTTLATGPRHHLWMYDGRSLSQMLSRAGFRDVVEMSPGVTNIPEPGALDLREREEESVYVEGRKPQRDLP